MPPKTTAYCKKCGNSLEYGKLPIEEPLAVCPCRFCVKSAMTEGFRSGRASAIAEYFRDNIESKQFIERE